MSEGCPPPLAVVGFLESELPKMALRKSQFNFIRSGLISFHDERWVILFDLVNGELLTRKESESSECYLFCEEKVPIESLHNSLQLSSLFP